MCNKPLISNGESESVLDGAGSTVEKESITPTLASKGTEHDYGLLAPEGEGEVVLGGLLHT